jgi:GTP cyclohydrolase IA
MLQRSCPTGLALAKRNVALVHSATIIKLKGSIDMDSSKVCAVTGKNVIDTLIAEGLMLPMTDRANVPRDVKVAKLTELFAEVIDVLGYDRRDEELQDTPRRIAKMWVDDLYNAWDPEKFPKCTSFDNKGVAGFQDEMVIVKDMRVVSNCAHHFIVTDIVVDAAYIPTKKMIGISKINKIVKRLARNPTSQETLGKAIARTLQIVTESDHVVVRIEGVHFCVKARGAEDVASSTVTLAALGKFAELDSALRKEFTAAIGR